MSAEARHPPRTPLRLDAGALYADGYLICGYYERFGSDAC